mgnify:CR=1 FL=1
MKKRKVTIAQAQKIQEKMCLEGRLTIEEAERVFDMCYDFTKKSAALFKNLPIREEFSYLK